jgi:hypothetical protein
MANKKNCKVVIEIAVEQNDILHYESAGFLECECPFCNHPIEFKLEPFKDNTSITPKVMFHFKRMRIGKTPSLTYTLNPHTGIGELKEDKNG